MSAPKTQRASADYSGTGALRSVAVIPWAASSPVLVVPEAAVKGCKHDVETWRLNAGYMDSAWLEVCEVCGSWRSHCHNNQRWQRPRLLRVKR